MTRGSKRQHPEGAGDLAAVGEIVRPHGIKGEVKVYSYSEQPENFKHYTRVFLLDPATGRLREYRVIKSREQGKLVILQLDGLTSRSEAEALQGRRIWLRKKDFPHLDAGEYYWHQLIGLRVCSASGRELGKVAALFSTRAHDVLVVRGRGREYLIPAKAEFIREIDERQGILSIATPPGLLEVNEEE